MTKEIKKKIYCAECETVCEGTQYHCGLCEEVFHEDCRGTHITEKHQTHIQQVEINGNEAHEIDSLKKVKIDKEWIR